LLEVAPKRAQPRAQRRRERMTKTRAIVSATEAPGAITRSCASSAAAAGTRARSWSLLQGDALSVCRALAAGRFDLIYADPPFFTGRAHRAAQGAGFDDAWAGDAEAYLEWLHPRLAAMRDLLAPTGSLLVHLDWHAVHAVKVQLDRLFGRERFVNEIIWSYRTGGLSTRRLARKHDTILFYARGPAYKFHTLRERSGLAHRYGFANAGVSIDARGPYRMTQLRDVWEIPALRGNQPERVAFPTQKPLALLRRVVALVTDAGDLVGDFFCGSGTTLVAAAEGGRRAVGGDISRAALHITQRRMEEIDRCI
jgi:DNA modification methylase